MQNEEGLDLNKSDRTYLEKHGKNHIGWEYHLFLWIMGILFILICVTILGTIGYGIFWLFNSIFL